MRNNENWADVSLKNFAATSIHEEFVFDLVKNYDTSESPGPNFLHDWAEREIPLSMINILQDLIRSCEWMKLGKLNEAIQELTDDNFDIIYSRIPFMKKEHITFKMKLKISVAESL